MAVDTSKTGNGLSSLRLVGLGSRAVSVAVVVAVEVVVVVVDMIVSVVGFPNWRWSSAPLFNGSLPGLGSCL